MYCKSCILSLLVISWKTSFLYWRWSSHSHIGVFWKKSFLKKDNSILIRYDWLFHRATLALDFFFMIITPHLWTTLLPRAGNINTYMMSPAQRFRVTCDWCPATGNRLVTTPPTHSITIGVLSEWGVVTKLLPVSVFVYMQYRVDVKLILVWLI